jgi:hypothetical protein
VIFIFLTGQPAWESEGVYVECQLRHFQDWFCHQAKVDNPLAPFPPQQFSGYIDYKYLKDVFCNIPDKLQDGMSYSGCRTVRGSADFRDSRVRFREKKFTSADKKFREFFFFFLGVNPSSVTDECVCAHVGMSCSQFWCKTAIFGG